MNDPYFAFVASAYAITGAAAAALTLWAFMERRAARRALGRAERALERQRIEGAKR